jgi:hypothetical protein
VREVSPPCKAKIIPLGTVFFVRWKRLSFRSGENIPQVWYFFVSLFLFLPATLRV